MKPRLRVIAPGEEYVDPHAHHYEAIARSKRILADLLACPHRPLYVDDCPGCTARRTPIADLLSAPRPGG